MRRLLTSVAVFAACGLALAQPPERDKGRPGGPPGGRPGFAVGGLMGRGLMGGGMAVLAMNPSVQEEIRLTDEQKEKLRESSEANRQKMRDLFEKMRDMSQEERQASLKQLAEDGKKLIDSVLKPDQLKRLQQISWQQAGIAAFAEEEVQTALKLNEDQKTKLRGIGEEFRQDIQELMRSMRDNPGQGREKMQALGAEYMEKALGSLTPEQRTAWKELTGKPFEVRMSDFPGGDRPGRERGRPRDKDRDPS